MWSELLQVKEMAWEDLNYDPFLLGDNASVQYACDAYNFDENESLLFRMLRFGKLLTLRVAQSYSARFAVLFALPLVLGLVLGLALPSLWRHRHWVTRRLPTFFLHSKPPQSWRESSNLWQQERKTRQALQSLQMEATRESKVPLQDVPKHIAVIMDGNRRYGKEKYQSASKGHWDGSRKVLDMCQWCIAEQVHVLTIYAFSTENWKRSPSEVADLMEIFVRYSEELRQEAIRSHIRVRVWSSDQLTIPTHVQQGLARLEEDTRYFTGGLQLNICLSYGSRGEITTACREIAAQCEQGTLSSDQIDESVVSNHLLSRGMPDPDVLLRTSGEIRLSNFLLWQLAYTEMFFMPKRWPEFAKHDLLEVIDKYARGRSRRFGK